MARFHTLTWGVVLVLLLNLAPGYAFEPKVHKTEKKEVAEAYAYFDDSTTILALRHKKLEVWNDDAETWSNVGATKDEKIIHLEMDPFLRTRAFAFTTDKNQYVTYDKGKNWHKFSIKNSKKEHVKIDSIPKVIFNAKNPNYALFEFYTCAKGQSFSELCEHVYFYTKDGFKNDPIPMDANVNVCTFVRSSSKFSAAKDETIICSRNKLNSFGHVVLSELVRSDNFFKSEDVIHHVLSKTGKIIDVRMEQNFATVVVQNDKFNSKSTVSLLVSTDATLFELADLTIDISYGVMNFVDSSPLSLFLAVMEYTNKDKKYSLTSLYSSDSSGLKYKKLMSRIKGGTIMKVQNTDGVWFVDVAESGESGKGKDTGKGLLDMLLGGGGPSKNTKSMISVDDGLTWQKLKLNGDESCDIKDDCSLQLLSPAERDGEGKMVTGPTPGILMGVGNKGKYAQQDISKMHTYVSRDGGISWDFALDEPCVFSFGDGGNIIVAIPYYDTDYSTTDTVYHSLDQGKTWKSSTLEVPIYPLTLTTTVDGSSTKFLLTGLVDKTPEVKGDYKFTEIIYALDYSGAFKGKKCTSKDFEDVYARVVDGEPSCIYGHKEKFQRRKQDAECFVDKVFLDIEVIEEPCSCTDADFECAPGFTLDKEGKTCVVDEVAITTLCAKEKKKELSIPSKQLVNGNKCKTDGKKLSDFVKTEKISCTDTPTGGDEKTPAGQKVTSKISKFEGQIVEYTYFDPTEKSPSENIIVKTNDYKVFASNDGGASFVRIPVDDDIVGYVTGYIPGQVVLLTKTEVFYVSTDGVNYFNKYKAPSVPNSVSSSIISFHKDLTDHFIWYASENCEDKYSEKCKVIAYHTQDGGDTFEELKSGVQKCDYVSPFFGDVATANNNTIFCSLEDRKARSLSLVSSTNFFKDTKEVFDNIVGYAITGVFVVVATIKDDKSLMAKVTVDGSTFADADFPADFKISPSQAYTVLDSESHSIFLHVTTNGKDGQQLGSILKSNSNGTSYVLSLDNVNRNGIGYVDYDRIDGLEGTIIANTVSNVDDVSNNREPKRLKTQITHNDGGEWQFITPPQKSSNGKKYSCIGSLVAKCSLNLHGFTERADYRDTFSSTSATGLIIGVGNVGEYLEHYDKAATFLSRDGGITWLEIASGVNMWEYGDHGTILVIVPSTEPTDTLKYSLDEGLTWIDFKFAEEPVKVLDLATIPSDTSRKFAIFAVSKSDQSHTLSYSIDFTNIHQRQCQLDLDNPNSDDYDFWTPRHPNLPDNCLFGHEAQYLRRAVGHNDCFIGSAPLKEGFKTIRNCSCTRRDFECDYNYFRDTDDTCKLVAGLSPTDRQNEYCKKENAFEYLVPTGYRKIPLSTCVGGKSFDSWDSKPCPGKEKEFNKHYGKELSGTKALLVLIIPLFVFLFSVWFVYDRGIRRNGGFKRLGQIRLDTEDDDFQPIENNAVDVVVNKIVSGGIFAVAGGIALFKTLRKVDKLMFDKLVSLIFRRGVSRRNYVHVPDIDDDEELFNDFRDDYELGLPDDDGHFRDEEDLSEFQSNDQDATEVDSRLFNIDDQSDDDLSSGR